MKDDNNLTNNDGPPATTLGEDPPLHHHSSLLDGYEDEYDPDDEEDREGAREVGEPAESGTPPPRPPPPPPSAPPAPAVKTNLALAAAHPGVRSAPGAAGKSAAPTTPASTSSSSTTTATTTLRGFWRKTVDQVSSSPAQDLWRQRVASIASVTGAATILTTSKTAASTSTTAAASSAGGCPTRSPLIRATELEQASLSPSGHPESAKAGFDDNPADEKKREDDGDGNDEVVLGTGKPESKQLATRAAAIASSEEDNENDEEDEDDIDEEEGEDDETASYVSSSAYSTSYVGSDATANNKFSALQWAAASVVDSVQSSGYFRGRYYASSSPSAPSPSKNKKALLGGAGGGRTSRIMGVMMPDQGRKSAGSLGVAPSSSTSPAGGAASAAAAVERGGTGIGGMKQGGPRPGPNQTTRILGSSHAQHMRELLGRLGPREYIMFLGRGMLGVNLKQSYLQRTGVYVDYLIPHGAAERSGLIRVGDLLRRVGDAPVDKQTILTIPQQIAKSPRPLHLVWATGTFPGVENMDPLEIAVAHMQRWRDDDDDEDDQGEEDVSVEGLAGGGSVSSNTSPPSSPSRVIASDAMLHHHHNHHRRHSSLSVVVEGEEEKKNDATPLAPADDTDGKPGTTDEPFSMTKGSVRDHPDVHIPPLNSIEDFCSPRLPSLAIQEAYHPFSACRNQGFSVMQLCQSAATDDNFRHALQHAFVLCAVDDRRFPFLSRHLSQQEEDDDRPHNSPSALLMLFVEMVGFADLYEVTPDPRRLQVANRLAHKFFLPTRLGHELLPPMFDFHQIVPDSALRALESSLRSGSVHRDLFGDFCVAAMESLSSHPFVTFLASAECARMRAYLRNTSVFVNVPLHRVFDAVVAPSADTLTPDQVTGRNYFCYVLLYLLCQTDREGYGEYDEQLSTGNGARCKDSAGSLCAAVFIRRRLVPEVRNAQADQDDEEAKSRALLCWERLWEIFVAPHVGALSLASLSNEAASYLSTLVSELNDIRTTCCDLDSVMARLCDEQLLRAAVMLADELIYSYASTVHSKFREHKFHEWMCKEFADARKQDANAPGEAIAASLPRYPEGCIRRLLRRATYPIGVAPHKPLIQSESEEEELTSATSAGQVNAECAVVFGSRIGLFDANSVLVGDSSDPIRRYASEVLYDGSLTAKALSLDEVPLTLESYAVVPSSHQASANPFKRYRDGGWISSDGWEVSLVNFRIPCGDTSDDAQDVAIYGVALVFRSLSATIEAREGRSELVFDSRFDPLVDPPVIITSSADSTKVTQIRTDVLVENPTFNKKLQEETWSERVSKQSSQSSMVGVALLSKRNVVLAMRETLSCLMRAFSSGPNLLCGPLVDFLGNFSEEDVESCALRAMLSPFIKRTSVPWLDRPISSQKHEFEHIAGRHILQSLPPVPLALMFVTALLEQKIVIASSRRSILLSASVALSKMLHPLSWCHLSVPRVPASLAADLMQYPAPFIIGIPSEDPGMMDLIREVPEDVTLVDLDIGRVLLAQSFSHVEFGRGTPNNPKTMRALRSQLLYLAQVLGGVFGSVANPDVWSCDRPPVTEVSEGIEPFDRVCSVCRDFLTELLAGTASCAYWIEEASSGASPQEPTVVFDEDRFFHIKSMRHRHGFQPLYDPENKAARPSLAVSLSDFELIVEVLMQCQSMNAYIASCNKDTMVYAR